MYYFNRWRICIRSVDSDSIETQRWENPWMSVREAPKYLCGSDIHSTKGNLNLESEQRMRRPVG